MMRETEDLIALLERKTGRTFDLGQAHPVDGPHQRAGTVPVGSRAGDRRSAALPGLDRRADDQHHDPAVASRVRLGGRARPQVPRRGPRHGRAGRRRLVEREAAPDVDRRRGVARSRVLPGTRRDDGRGVRLVDVPAFRRPAVHPRGQGQADGGARQPHLLDQRSAAPAAVDERLDGQRGGTLRASMRRSCCCRPTTACRNRATS